MIKRSIWFWSLQKRYSTFYLLILIFSLLASPSAFSQVLSADTTDIFAKRGDHDKHLFIYSPAFPEVGQPVQFAETSQDIIVLRKWDFGDGKSSTRRNPRHSFVSPGFYRVTLTAQNLGGLTKRFWRTISVRPRAVAMFNYSPSRPVIGQEIKFIDTTSGSPTSWHWNFGDGTTSSVQNPTHIYRTAASYTVILIAETLSGAKKASKTLTVVAPASEPSLHPNFTFYPISPAPAQTIQFTDTSVGTPTSWYWEFNDGMASSEQNPKHAFSTSGSYNVTLTVMNAYGSNSISKNIIVESEDGSIRTYWVSPTGTAKWINARNSTPLAGAACCSLSTANANAVAGDTIMLRGGIYSTSISPARSGSATSRITYAAYAGEIPTFTVDEAGGRWAIKLLGRQYIKIDGITSSKSLAFFFIGYGSCHNEIVNCTFDRSSYIYSLGLICDVDTAFNKGAGSNHNWIHNCTFSRYGYVSGGDDIGTIRISAAIDDSSSNNTFEDCVFFYGGHDCLDVGGRYNVVRNNVFHNEEGYFKDTTRRCTNTPSSGYFGNRNIILSNYGDGIGTAQSTLIEANRIGYAGTPPDDDGSCGIENAGVHTIARYNYVYGNGGMGYYSKMQGSYSSSIKSGSWARVYNNTIYSNGHGDVSIDDQFKHGICVWSYANYDDWPRNVVIKNNIVYDNYNEWQVGTNNILRQITYANNYSLNPSFTNTDMSDKSSLTLPGLGLQAGSPCINAGTYLTQASSPGSNSASLVVIDSLFFQDGAWGSSLSGIQADWIAIGTVNNVVQIKSIDYKTNIITLTKPMTWNAKAPVWLYRNSRGKQVLLGTAPDIGAYEIEQR